MKIKHITVVCQNILFLQSQKSYKMKIQELLKESIYNFFNERYNADIDKNSIKIERTKEGFEGDFSVNVFPFLKIAKTKPEILANELGTFLQEKIKDIYIINVVKGFLNITLSEDFWKEFANTSAELANYPSVYTGNKIVLEFSSPNTNKPLHLGHIRNNLLGESMSKILKLTGANVIKVNLVNDRGIHICKSMLAWMKWGDGKTPADVGVKGDKFVGDFYVLFDQKYKEQIKELVEKGMSEEEAKKEAPLIKEAQKLLEKWEAGDPETLEVWNMMNEWVYEGFDETYKKLGVSFDKIYYESKTYKKGKELVYEGLHKGVFYKKEDGSVWVDLRDRGLDQKLLLRSDGTSVYITQDIGTFIIRDNDYHADKYMYVVGNEQEYHFKVLKEILNKLGLNGNKVVHISYGMVNLPSGKMKSREGTVVDADDLIEEVVEKAKEKADELGKLDNLDETAKKKTYEIIGLGALKYFILKIDAKKDMLFNPQQSVDFEGNTAPFIQYTHVRIQSLINKAKNQGINSFELKNIDNPIRNLLKYLYEYPQVIAKAALTLNPAVIANYIYDLAREYNQFYQTNPILKAEDENTKKSRLFISQKVASYLEHALSLFGINIPEKM
jgi:arginyl-tRNA synthetase